MSGMRWEVRGPANGYGVAAGLVIFAVAVLAIAWRPLLATDGFMPHGVCYAWRPGLVRLHVISNVLIGSAYFSILAALVYFIRKRRDLPFSWILLLFGLFIFACGATHWMEVWTTWQPRHWLAGVVKAIAAAASVPTAIALAYLIPHALAIPGITQVREAKAALEDEVAERRRAETALREAHATLEQRVQERTMALDAAHAEVQHQREWLHVTLASIGDAVIATGREGRVSFMNPVAETLTGWIQYEASQHPLEEVFRIIDARTREPAENPALKAIRENAIVGLSNHTVLIARDGTERSIDDSAAPIRNVIGEIIGVVLIFRDISERRRAEAAEREAREQAEAANRLKDEFLATVSHELRSPLNSIVGWLHVLQKAPAGTTDAQQAIEKIRRNVNTQARLISDLLDVSRIITGKLRLEIRRVDPVALLDSAVESVRAAAEAKRIEIILDAEPSSVWLPADPDRLGQVLWNLLSNAIKFTPEGGRVEIHMQQTGTQLHIVIADNGEGIEPSFLPHVFERFRQGEVGHRGARQGLGLGLAVVRHIVEMHGGSVHAQSDGVGRGAIFTIKLPIPALVAAHDDRRAPSLEVLPPLRLDDVRVLVVDDEEDAREVLQGALSSFGAEVQAVGNAEEAVEVLRAWQPHVLVSDIGLGVSDGYALLRRVRALDAASGGRTPAVALTALARPDDRLRALAAGFQMHVAKPVEPGELALVIASLVGRLPNG